VITDKVIDNERDEINLDRGIAQLVRALPTGKLGDDSVTGDMVEVVQSTRKYN